MAITEDGSAVLFLRSLAGDDPVHHLWRLDLESGAEQQLVDVSGLAIDDDLPVAERRRRERLREGGAGITGFATDRAGDLAAFSLGGELFTVDVREILVEPQQAPAGAFDPRPSPDESHIAFVADGALWVTATGSGTRELVAEEGVTWGLAEFAAAEEMRRLRGFWWSPDSSRLAVTRVDETRVTEWHIADPAHPDQPSQPHRYPAAGTPNADVRLFLVDLDGNRQEVTWDRHAFEYLAAVDWSRGGLSILVESRDQRHVQLLLVDEATGDTAVEHELTDDTWIALTPGTPARLEDGRAVLVGIVDGQDRLLIGGAPVTDGLNVSAVADVDGDRVLFTANDLDEPTADDLWLWEEGSCRRLTSGDALHAGRLRGDVLVVTRAGMDAAPAAEVRVNDRVVPIRSVAEEPDLAVNVAFRRVGDRSLASALLLPGPDSPFVDAPTLPVLLDPYGGPGFSRVQRARNAWLTPQWFADQGFAVVVIDGRGTPGRGPAWERTVYGDLAAAALQDQFDGLDALAESEPRLDLSRVAIRGWSFGGYLAALAAIRRPDRIRAAIVGAPVTDMRLYDTHWTERYLGTPDDNPAAYTASAVVDDDGLAHAAPVAPGAEPGILVIHGLADDNVVAAHALRFSSALLAAGRPHEFLPLSGVTHMTPQAAIAENMLLHQAAFLHRHLGETS